MGSVQAAHTSGGNLIEGAGIYRRTSLPGCSANLDGVLKELEKARSNQLEMMHALGFVMQYRTACAPPGPSLRKPALL